MADKKKIVAVDDSMENLIILKNILKDKYTIFPVPSAGEMFELLEHISPNLILLDVEMPEMNGYEAAQKLKGDDKLKEIPFIFLTSRDDEESIKKGFDSGAVDYIAKPIVVQVLLERIEKYI
jgi:putative two-component system response regulator